MSDVIGILERKHRILVALPLLSESLAEDIRFFLRFATPFEENGLPEQQPLEAPPPAAASAHVKKTTPRTVSRSKRRGPRAELSTEQKDDLRLQLLEVDKHGDLNTVRELERHIRKTYKIKRLGGLRSHASGEWKGPFIARLLQRANSKRQRDAMIARLSALYGESKEAILAASKQPAPKYK